MDMMYAGTLCGYDVHWGHFVDMMYTEDTL